MNCNDVLPTGDLAAVSGFFFLVGSPNGYRSVVLQPDDIIMACGDHRDPVQPQRLQFRAVCRIEIQQLDHVLKARLHFPDRFRAFLHQIFRVAKVRD